jgi:hypothetical protein
MYYNAALGKQHYQDSLYFSLSADVATSTISGQPALVVTGSGPKPKQVDIDEFLGVPGDVLEEYVDATSVPADGFAVIINMEGQADPLALGVQGVGSVGQLQVLGLNNNGGVPAGEPGKKMVFGQTDKLIVGQGADDGALVSPAGNLVFRWQMPDARWGTGAQTFAQVDAAIEVKFNWFPK